MVSYVYSFINRYFLRFVLFKKIFWDVIMLVSGVQHKNSYPSVLQSDHKESS